MMQNNVSVCSVWQIIVDSIIWNQSSKSVAQSKVSVSLLIMPQLNPKSGFVDFLSPLLSKNMQHERVSNPLICVPSQVEEAE